MPIDASTRVAAIVVTYNRKDLLLQCLDALQRQTLRALLTVCVVDNDSSDGTCELLEERVAAGELVHLRLPSNVGGAGGFAHGMQYATEQEFDYLWVMDDDCLPSPSALEELLVYAQALDGDFGFLSSKALWTDGTICQMNIQRTSIFSQFAEFDEELAPIQIATFVSCLVPASVVREFGLPIAEFFVWTDDWEFTRRVSRELPGYYVGSSVVTHACAVNSGAHIANEQNHDRFDRYRGMFRNSVYLYRREGVLGVAYALARAGSHATRVLLHAPDSKLERLGAVVCGTIDGTRFNPPIRFPQD